MSIMCYTLCIKSNLKFKDSILLNGQESISNCTVLYCTLLYSTVSIVTIINYLLYSIKTIMKYCHSPTQPQLNLDSSLSDYIMAWTTPPTPPPHETP